MCTKYIELEVINSETILTRVIQVVKKRRLDIQSFIAEELCPKENTGIIKVWLKTDEEKLALLKPQLEKIIEVIEVRKGVAKIEFQHHDFIPAY